MIPKAQPIINDNWTYPANKGSSGISVVMLEGDAKPKFGLNPRILT